MYIRKRLTYSNVIATLALFLALGGASAIAASQLGKNSVGSKQLKKNAVTAAKIKNGAVTQAKISGAAQTALKGATGPQGPVGPVGPVGPAGSSLAFARIEENGTVDLSKSKNVTSANVTHPLTGLYCFSGLSFAPKNAVASPQFFEPKPVTLALFMGQYEGCPGNTQVSVQMLQEGNTERASPFTILFN
jgi:hypothetical protein